MTILGAQAGGRAGLKAAGPRNLHGAQVGLRGQRTCRCQGTAGHSLSKAVEKRSGGKPRPMGHKDSTQLWREKPRPQTVDALHPCGRMSQGTAKY